MKKLIDWIWPCVLVIIMVVMTISIANESNKYEAIKCSECGDWHYVECGSSSSDTLID